MPQIIQFNDFSELHNEKNIFFCKTDHITEEFDKISKIDSNVVLITGNSDIPISEETVNKAPKNISAWFCQNNLSSNPKVFSLPLGIENTKECKRSGHGVAWNFAEEKLKILSTIFNKDIQGDNQNLIYANFNVDTNLDYRNTIKEHCLNLNHVTFKSGLPYEEFICDLLSHEAALCPVGNGIDTHRIYETLYANKVAIVFSDKQEFIYESLYKDLPVVLLQSLNDLDDEQFLYKKINEAKSNNKQKLDLDFWKNKILSYV